MNRDKVGKKFMEIADIPPTKAKKIFDRLHRNKSWSRKEYDDLTTLYALLWMSREERRCMR